MARGRAARAPWPFSGEVARGLAAKIGAGCCEQPTIFTSPLCDLSTSLLIGVSSCPLKFDLMVFLDELSNYFVPAKRISTVGDQRGDC